MISVLLFLIVIPHTVFSQDSTFRYGNGAPYAFGIMFGSSIISNQSSIAVQPGSPECGIYEKGTSNGLSLGIFGEYTVIPSFLSLSSRVYFAQHPSSLQHDGCNYPVYNRNTLVYDTLSIRNSYTISLDRFVFDLGASLYPIPDIPFFVRIGASAGYGLSENTYQKTQTVLYPEYVGFTSKDDRYRVIETGEVKTNFLLATNASIGYFLPISPIVALMPEISYMQSLNSLLKDQDWKSSSFDFRIGIAYRPLEKIQNTPLPAPPPVELPEIIPPPPAIAIINPVQFAAIEAPNLELQQTIITQTFPILPYIFFDSSSTIPKSIHVDVNPDYDETQVTEDALTTYNNILPIIAKRMMNQPEAMLVLTGATDGKEKSTIQLRKALGIQRAQSIKDIMVQSWGMNPDRIIVKSRDLPSNLSNDEYIEGDAENRRVEIESSHPDILNPVVYSKFNEFVPIQQHLRLAILSDSTQKITTWNIEIKHHGILLKKINGEGYPPEFLDIPIDSAIISGIGNQVLNLRDSVDIVFHSQTDKGEDFTTETSKPIIKSNNTFELSRLSLIVFEYDESSLSDKNKAMMKNFLQNEIRKDSKVFIIGSTDKLGEVQYNLELSETRAKTVESFLKNMQPDINIVTVKGIGISTRLFDNSLPEGRYYCRTVSIEVQNPIQPLPGK
ncbi:MAG: OmpA family protein [Candidatus Kapaibacteriota bacterium]